MLFPRNEPRLSSVARFATERRRSSALEWSTRRVLSAIFPRTNARPAAKTAAAEGRKPGFVEMKRKLDSPNAMLDVSEFLSELLADLDDNGLGIGQLHAEYAWSQLELSLNLIAEEGRGLLIYEHQEGRGIGLLNKLRAYELQDGGADTVEANERLGFEADLRDYEMPAEILRYFNVRSVRLLSNNPDKIAALERAGIRVAERIPCIVAPHESTEGYLRTKKQKLGHLLD